MSSRNKYNTPEKRYIRDRWLKYSKQRAKANNVEFIKYLTLPGRDCYDIIHLSEIIKKKEVGYDKDYLTFVEKDIEYYTDIRNKLPRANNYKGSFEDFVENARQGIDGINGDDNTVNYYTFFPYDVVNLDFTWSPFRHGDSCTSPQMQSIKTLFELQSIHHSPFSLFLTFSATEKFDDNEGKKAVNEALVTISNNPKHLDFKKLLVKHGYKEGEPYYDITEYHKFLLVGVPMIIINYGYIHNFDISCINRFTYIGTGNTTRMISMIFDCKHLSTDSYNGMIIETINNKLRPFQLQGIFNHYEDINELFKRNKELKLKYF